MRLFLSLMILAFLPGCGIYALADGAGCFVKGTKIQTPQGEVAIESLTAGREVLAWDEAEHKIVVGIVDELIVHDNSTPGTLVLGNGVFMGITGDHPVYIAAKHEWIPVAGLQKGDEVTFYHSETKSTDTQAFSSFEINLPVQTTYNLKVRHYENSFAAGMLAHFY